MRWERAKECTCCNTHYAVRWLPCAVAHTTLLVVYSPGRSLLRLHDEMRQDFQRRAADPAKYDVCTAESDHSSAATTTAEPHPDSHTHSEEPGRKKAPSANNSSGSDTSAASGSDSDGDTSSGSDSDTTTSSSDESEAPAAALVSFDKPARFKQRGPRRPPALAQLHRDVLASGLFRDDITGNAAAAVDRKAIPKLFRPPPLHRLPLAHPNHPANSHRHWLDKRVQQRRVTPYVNHPVAVSKRAAVR